MGILMSLNVFVKVLIVSLWPQVVKVLVNKPQV